MTMNICNKLIPLDLANMIVGFSNERPAIAAVSKQWNSLATTSLEKDYQAILAEDPLLAEKVTYLSSTPLTGPASKLQMIFLSQFREWMSLSMVFAEELSWMNDSAFLPQWPMKYKWHLLYQLKTREDYPVESTNRSVMEKELLKAHTTYGKDRFIVIDLIFFKAMREKCATITQTRCSYYLFEKFMPAYDLNLDKFIRNIVVMSQGFGGTVPFDIQKGLLDTIVTYRCNSAFASFTKALQAAQEDPQQILALVHLAVLDSNKQNYFDLLIQSYTYLKQSNDPDALKVEFSDGINPFSYAGDPAMLRYGVANGGYQVNNTTATLSGAVRAGNTDAVDALLRLGAPVHKDHFFAAAKKGYVWIVDKLLSQPPIKVNQTFARKKTALHILAEDIHSSQDAARLEPVIRVLLRHGANLDAADKFHKTPRALLLNSSHISDELQQELSAKGEPPKKKRRTSEI